MQTKNSTPFLFGSKVTSLRPQQLQMTMIVKGSFRLRPNEPLTVIESLVEQPPLSAEVYADGDDDRARECTTPSDFADFKLNAEVLLTGSCHAPGGRPVAECPVRLAVGAWSKSLVVTGRRTWTERLIGAAVTDPHPFSAMALSYANAFGGPPSPRNPVGKGMGTAELPNVEHPGARVRGKGDRPEPASFGPLSSSWPQRASKVGTQYGAKWKKERAPFYAEDFDWSHFQAGAPDQQLPGYLRGDEEVSLTNLHPAASSFSVRLPGLRVRAFAKDARGVVREAPMKLDTLFVELDKERIVLTWRGLVSVEQDDLSDVKTVLIASESLADAPASEAHYLDVIAEFEADPLETDKHVPGGRKQLEELQAIAKDDDENPDRSPTDKLGALLEKEDFLVSLAPEDKRASVREGLAKQREQLAAAPPAPPAPANPGEALAKVVKETGEAVKQLRAVAVANGEPLDDVEQLEKMLDDPALKKRLAALSPPTDDEIGPGKDLSGRNLSRMNLSGRDLTRASLKGAILDGAQLVGTRLVGADLSDAALNQANLTDADLSGADLSRSFLSKARAPGAKLDGAKLDQAILQNMDLTRASFVRATCQMLVLSGSDLTDAKLQGCDFFKAFAEAAILERADFTEARLVQCTFMRARAAEVVLARAFLTSSTFADSDLRKANVVDARGEGTSWLRAHLEDADFRRAVLPAAHFMEAKATGARFFGADLRRAELYRACLDHVDFERANLFAANLNKATVNGTRFVHANLYDARLLGTSGKGADLNGANLEKAMLPS